METLFHYFIDLPKEIQSILFITYFMVIPWIYRELWDDANLQNNSKHMSYLRWYFLYKSPEVNWVGHITVILLGLGSLVWWLIYIICTGIMYVIYYLILVPIGWLFEFIFLNKDCSHLNYKTDWKVRK